MSLFVWILLGLVSGFIASHLVNHRGEGLVLDVLLGVVGAIIGGWIFHVFGHIGVTGLNLQNRLGLGPVITNDYGFGRSFQFVTGPARLKSGQQKGGQREFQQPHQNSILPANCNIRAA